MSRNVKIGVAVVAAAGVAIALLTSLAQGRQTSGFDASLQRTADRIKAWLATSDSQYAAAPGFLDAFNLYQHNQQQALLLGQKQFAKPGQFAQLHVYETETMPPVWRFLRSNKYPAVQIDAKSIEQAAAGKSTFTTVHQGNLEFRGYLTAVPVPASLRAGNTHEVLEVFEAQSG